MQGKVHGAIDKFYLEGLSKQFKREERFKSKYRKQYEEEKSQYQNVDFSEFVDALKTSSKNFVAKVKGIKKEYLREMATAFQEQGNAPGITSVDKLAMKGILDCIEEKFTGAGIEEFLSRADVLNVPRTKLDSTGIAESAKAKKVKKVYKENIEDENIDTASGTDLILDNQNDPELVDYKDEEDAGKKDAFEIAQEILSEIDIVEISNGVRLALIEALIDSAQNAIESDDANDEAFNEFMVSIQDIVDSFRYDDENIEEPEMDELGGELEEPVEGDLETGIVPPSPAEEI